MSRVRSTLLASAVVTAMHLALHCYSRFVELAFRIITVSLAVGRLLHPNSIFFFLSCILTSHVQEGDCLLKDSKFEIQAGAIKVTLPNANETNCTLPSMTLPNGDVYDAIQLHIHTRSEHTIEGVRYPAELHIVHVGESDLAVVAVMLDVTNDDPNTDFEPYISGFDAAFDEMTQRCSDDHTYTTKSSKSSKGKGYYSYSSSSSKSTDHSYYGKGKGKGSESSYSKSSVSSVSKSKQSRNVATSAPSYYGKGKGVAGSYSESSYSVSSEVVSKNKGKSKSEQGKGKTKGKGKYEQGKGKAKGKGKFKKARALSSKESKSKKTGKSKSKNKGIRNLAKKSKSKETSKSKSKSKDSRKLGSSTYKSSRSYKSAKTQTLTPTMSPTTGITRPTRSANPGGISVYNLIPNGRHFSYFGSLTTPPCTEAVNWIVMEQPLSISVNQFYPLVKYVNMFLDEDCELATIASSGGDTFRPIQPLNDRDVSYMCD